MAKVTELCKTRSMLAVYTLLAALALDRPVSLGIFDGETDVGSPAKQGSGGLSQAAYLVAGGGSNMWFNSDAFHFVWKRVSGDVTLAADIEFLSSEPGADPHRKAVLMVRQSLHPDSAYADAAIHGDGLTSLQYRDTKGGRTYEIQANTSRPRRLRIEKRGQYVSMSVAAENGDFSPAGGSFRLALEEPFYVGLGVCAHNKDRIEMARFGRVDLKTGPDAATTNLWSTLETVPIASKDRRVVLTTPGRIEAPNWTPNGSNLIYNAQGRIHSIPWTGGAPTTIDTGFATRCNNDHGISPDGKTLVISDQTQGDRKSRIYTLPISGGAPKLITEKAPSYWHGWSPDGKTLVFCGERNGEFDIYTVPVEGGAETRLTEAKGLDDGPDYSAYGKWIYFNSDRTGQMHVWRMRRRNKSPTTNSTTGSHTLHLTANGWSSSPTKKR
jgi:TolB protein